MFKYAILILYSSLIYQYHQEAGFCFVFCVFVFVMVTDSNPALQRALAMYLAVVEFFDNTTT